MTKEEKEDETTTTCPNPKCGRVIYKGELCSCNKRNDKYGFEIPLGDQHPYISNPPKRG